MNRKTIIILLGIFFTLILSVSLSLAFFYYSGESDDISLTSGSIKLSFTEGTNNITTTGSFPKADEVGMIDVNYYDFTINGSKGDDDIRYEIQIVSTSSNTLDERYVKLYLTDQNNETVVGPVALSDLTVSEYNNNRILYSNYITATDQVYNYRLRVWIDSSYDNNTSESIDFKVNLLARNEKSA